MAAGVAVVAAAVAVAVGVVAAQAAVAAAVVVVVSALEAAVAPVRAVVAAIAIVGIEIAPVAATRAMAIVRRVGPETEIVIAKGTAAGIGAEIGIETERANGTAIVTATFWSIAARAFTSRRTMATMDTAQTPTSEVTRTACTPALTMRAEDKATIRSVHTFTGKALPVSSPFSAAEALTNKPIAMAFCGAMTKATTTTKGTEAGSTHTRSVAPIRSLCEDSVSYLARC